MKYLYKILICLVFLLGQVLSAQITQAEYFWDTDPGEGNGIAILAFDGDFDQAIEQLSANGIAPPAIGTQTFNIRVNDGNDWGPVFTTVLQNDDAQSSVPIIVSQAEYFWNTDPGEGNGLAILAFDGDFDQAIEQLSVNGITPPEIGTQTFNIRVSDGNNWGPVFTTVLQNDDFQSSIPIIVTQAEYFWDTDPGEGNGLAILAFDGDFDQAIEQLSGNELPLPSQGLHTFNIRVRDTNNWGPVFTTVVQNDVADEIDPIIVDCPMPITQANDIDTCQAVVTWTPPTATDNIEVASLTTTHNPGDIFPVGVTTVIYTATDTGGNTATCSFDITITDGQDPVFMECPQPIVQVIDAGQTTAIVNWVPPTASDNCDTMPVVTSTHNPGDTFPLGETIVTYTTIDVAGNSMDCSFTITVTENQPPIIVDCPTNVTAENTVGECAAIVTWTLPTATDDGTVTLTSTHNPGDSFPVGTTTVTYTATDDAGATTNCSFDITVLDTENPSLIDCPANITQVIAIGQTTAILNWTPPTATDNCDTSPMITSTHSPGDTFPLGETIVTYTAIDVAENSMDCSFTITVIENQPPVIVDCPTNVTAENTVGECAAIVTWTPPTATDDGTVTLTSTHNPGDTFPVGETIVTYTATDDIGATTNCSFTITVVDTEDPVLSNCPTDIIQSNDMDMTSAVVTWTVPNATDNCDVTLTATHNPGDTFPLGNTTVTYTATDNAGNTVNCSFVVTVEDNQDPVLSNCPTDISVSNDSGVCNAIVNWTAPTATDEGSVTLTSTQNPGDVFPVGDTVVTYTATDAAGNSVSCNFTVTVTDDESPVLSDCPTDISQSVDAGLCLAIVNWTIPTVTDNCSATITSSHNPGDTFVLGNTTVTYTATDAAGNSVSCSFIVTITDDEAPELTCPSDQTVPPIVSGGVYTVPDYFATGEAMATDNCTTTVTIVSQDPIAGTELIDGVYPILLTAEDDNGNSVNCTFELTVDSTLSISDDFNVSSIKLYPNPTVGELVFETQNTVLTKAEVYDIRGRLVQLKSFVSDHLYSMDISSLEASIYIIRLYSENGMIVKRVVKK